MTAGQADPVPVTLLTGFLGAGKTTLLNAMLGDASAGRIAVIVNEFGEAGLDHDLIETSSDEIVLMQSGCLCCSIRGDLSRTMAGLLHRRADGALHFDRVVIETTGMADPGPILQTLVVDPYLGFHTKLDGVVTVVDAANGPATLDAQFEAVSQVAMADMIVLSKTDLTAPGKVRAFGDRLTSINPAAQILHAVRGEGTGARLWGISGARHGVQAPQVLAWATMPDALPDPLANLSGLGRPVPAPLPVHDTRIGSASIVLDDPIPEVVFDLWLDTLIGLRGPDILRVKGIVFLEGIDTPFVFHGVQQVFDAPVQLRDWTGDSRQSRIVVIARDMSRPELQRSLDMLRGRMARGQPNRHVTEVTYE
ncbi:CobW family GTP-binding protein [Chachezhania sediminis]|uniref:CobW family GTP-binding protein n=1 Tax=Chachezhania sediminis TaxID=2599291 RepID=UPI00131B1B34|nr:GTP-binding protein [Chachezhania sediminis]